MRLRPLARIAAAALLTVVVSACGGTEAMLEFDPSAPCPAEGQMPGAYPDLEALVPATYDGRGPDKLDSGRLCTEETLGTLAESGITELRFAGATWQTGGTSGLTLAVFTAEGLDPDRMLEFYAVPAEAARRTERLERSDTTVGSVGAKRLDVLGTDGTGQTIVIWQEADDGPVRVMLAADLGDARVAELLRTLDAP